MDFYFLKGLLLGLSIAAPVGPIGLLCIRRSIALGQKQGFVTGLGAAVADGFYGAVAAFGLTWISQALIEYQALIQLSGGVFLGWIAVGILRPHKLATNGEPVRQLSLWRGFLSSLLVTLSNPATILAFVAAFAVFNVGPESDDLVSASVMTTGVFLGSALWWLCLSWFASRFRAFEKGRAVEIVNRASGVLLLVFAAVATAMGLRALFSQS